MHQTTFTFTLTALLLTAAAFAQEGEVEEIGRACRALSEEQIEIAAEADLVGLLPGPSAGIYFDGRLLTARDLTREMASVSLAELASGVDASYGYYSLADSTLPPGFYTQRLTLRDPHSSRSPIDMSMLDAEGLEVARAAGQAIFTGPLPPPGRESDDSCSSTCAWGTDESGEGCMNCVFICDFGDGDAWVAQACFQIETVH